MITSKQIAKKLLQSGVIRLNADISFDPSVPLSSPVYFDSRLINSNVALRDLVTDAFVDLIKEKFNEAELIAGVVTGGLPYGVIIADRLTLPFVYVRSEAKGHGLKKQVEGFWIPGSKVIVIEDHLDSGIRTLVAVNALQQEQLSIIGVASIFNSEGRSSSKSQVQQCSLCNLETVLEVAIAEKVITSKEQETILMFRESN